MKGTLFSADFVKDSSGNLRLLELNTDTGFIAETIQSNRFDFTDFKNLLSTNNITELVLVYKIFQGEFVDALEAYINSDATFITTITKQIEDSDTIYPAAVTDSDDKFILRLAYDENALFDSTYCKERANVQKLFYDNSATGSIPEFYYSGSDYVVNTLTSDVNDHAIIPDFITKTKEESHSALKFVNLGGADSSSADRINRFIGNFSNVSETTTIEKYHYYPSDITDNGKVSGFRKVGIVYGSNIEFVSLGGWRVESFFALPTESDLTWDVSEDDFLSVYNKKHYFELTSNWLRTTVQDAIHEDSILIQADGNTISAGDAVSGSVLKSMYIHGLPDTDDAEVYRQWSVDGSTLPSGSYVTSSIVELQSSDLGDNYGVVGEIKLANDQRIYSTITKHFLTYSTGSDEYKFLQQHELNVSDHFLIDADDNKIGIVSNTVAVLDADETGSFLRLDIEDTDSYFVSSSENAFIVHNAPCFAEGTQIAIEAGDKNIEDVEIGDEVWSFNHTSQERELNRVNQVMQKELEETVRYILSDDTSIVATPDHPFYIVELNGYASYKPADTLADSGLEVSQIEIGHTLWHIDSQANPEHIVQNQTITDIQPAETQTVYNLDNVEKNNNFFANGFLVHNRACCFAAGTEILMEDDSIKLIEDIDVGDGIQGWDSENGHYTLGKVTAINHRDTVGSHEEACKSLGDLPSLYTLKVLDNDGETLNIPGIEFTPEHPFLTKDGWKSLVPDNGQEPYLSEQEPKVLKVGDFININEQWQEIKEISVVRSDASEKVYNFTVDGIHSYIANGIVVHNK
jgi:hypothetical protein